MTSSWVAGVHANSIPAGHKGRCRSAAGGRVRPPVLDSGTSGRWRSDPPEREGRPRVVTSSQASLGQCKSTATAAGDHTHLEPSAAPATTSLKAAEICSSSRGYCPSVPGRDRSNNRFVFQHEGSNHPVELHLGRLIRGAASVSRHWRPPSATDFVHVSGSCERLLRPSRACGRAALVR